MTETSLDGLLPVLCLPPMSQSLDVRPWFARIENITLVEWFAGWFAGAFPSNELHVLTHSLDDFHKLKEMLDGKPCSVFHSDHKAALFAFDEIASQRRAAHATFFELGLALAPRDILKRAYSHHLKFHNGSTRITGFPPHTTPVIYARSELNRLARRESLDFIGPPIGFVSRVRRLAALRDVRTTLVREWTPMDAAIEYGVDRNLVPSRVEFTDPADTQILCDVLTSIDSSRVEDPDFQGFRLWNQMTRDSKRRTSRNLPSCFPFPNASGSKIRVLYVSNCSALSGPEQNMHELVSHLDRERFEPVAFVALDGVLTRKLRGCGVEVVSPRDDFSVATVENFERCLAVVRMVKPEIVHLNGPVGVPFLTAAIAAGTRIVQHLRVPDVWALEDHLTAANAIVAVSNFVRNEAIRYGISEERIAVIYNGVDPKKLDARNYSRAEARDRLSLPRECKVVAMVARFDPNKRQDLLIEAANLLRAEMPELRVVLVGEAFDSGLYFESLRRKLDRYGLNEVVTCTGFIDDIASVYSACDVLVFCSKREALGNCILEAMSMERPVIVTDNGGSPEIVRDGVTGYVLRTADPSTLSSAIKYALSNPDLMNRIGAAARREIEEHFSIEKTSLQIAHLYEELLKE
ncbi:MAG TPA: glycosyltransferase family 4 protein [Terriglobia bacterium]|nr:glycosyltransferase family 4 protein [Terriglobia bacterium]